MTEADVAAARDEVSAGKAVTVWFTAAAVGVPAGGSAKVVAVGDVAEGDFIQVRPAGSRDTMFCSPGELTRTRPARKPAATRRRPEPATPPPAAPPTPTPSTPAPPPAVRARRATAPPSAPRPPEEAAPAAAPGTTPAKKAPARTRSRADRPAPVTVSLTSTVEGDWTVEVRVGAKKIVSATPVPATDVAAVSRSLPAAVAEVMTSALAEARRRQEERVARLREELDAAQRTLEQFAAD
ncbi:DUF6319 family protein [Pseudonocardia sp.]|uniref:DUF6319 family protein n=1 Tax=Pseudonocardia sp. TaxID=60912 RepID=UPI003D116A62